MKPNDYPLALVKEVVINSLGEVTEAELFKGKTRETVKRHSSCLIPLLERCNDSSDVITSDNDFPTESHSSVDRASKRKAALKSRELTKILINSGSC